MSGLSELPEEACGPFKAVALLPGSTELTATSTPFSPLASIQVSAFPPLVAVDPETVAMVTIGFSKTVVFEGGPRDHGYSTPSTSPSHVSPCLRGGVVWWVRDRRHP